MRAYPLRTAALTTTWFVALLYDMTVHTLGVEDIPVVVRTAELPQRNVLQMALSGMEQSVKVYSVAPNA
jgi:hypothetical protein